jgi:glutathione S-transferase
MLRIWGRLSSINVRKVIWAARELELAFKRIDAGAAFGLVDTPEYRRRNPNGLVPLADDDGFVLWESNTIVRYLCAKHASGTLYPEPLAVRFDAERWMDWQQTTVNPAARDAFVQLVRTPPQQRDPAALARSNASAERVFALLDAHLADRAYVAGDRFTMADIPLGCEAHRWFGLPQAREPRPHVERWYATLRARRATDGVLELPLS